ncbi:hypothetical protein OJF2_77330 [Aquisphaera giovannonii]|uniref:Uncharacterized protein n=1 Tax=Aquisphaera giovannonii TaxID=406548 RepID=A0A5B9WGI5_9BACT|nr:carboxypeptidase-like regulatory domain-containing protein [Aquisphaera giovannonii]QEH39121.1 hypothetical protein OJF2_77330 [Aquisphaera giovannonii]
MLAHVISLAMLMFLPIAEDDLIPFTVTVVNERTGEPVRSFRYQMWYEPRRQGSRDADGWTQVESPDGILQLRLPRPCRLNLEVEAADFVGGHPELERMLLRSDDRERGLVVRLRPGIVVRGVVRDAETKAPIAGAKVAPLKLHGKEIWWPDEDRQVTTDAAGRYEVRGVDPEHGVAASHPDYASDVDFSKVRKVDNIQDVFLKREPGAALTITVVDSTGKRLEGMAFDYGAKSEGVSGHDGVLRVKGSEVSYGRLRKAGIIDKHLTPESLEDARRRGGLEVVMEPTIALTGRVVGPDGRPVAAYTIAAGPGVREADEDMDRRDIRGDDGRFRLDLAKEGRSWICVVAPGFAPWEGWTDLRRGGPPVEITLSRGVAVSGRLDVPEGLRGRVRATLTLRHDDANVGGDIVAWAAEDLEARAARLGPDGSLRFEDVRPDRYWLIVDVQDMLRTSLLIDVPAEGIDMGALPIRIPVATGRIEGRVWHPKGEGGAPWAFGDGYVGDYSPEVCETIDLDPRGEDHLHSIPFLSDEDGRFRVDRVPVGLNAVSFLYLTGDVQLAYTWYALVAEGQTTRVLAFAPDARRPFTLAPAIGDGSASQFVSGTGLDASRRAEDFASISGTFAALSNRSVRAREPVFWVELMPLSNAPLSFAFPGWVDLDAEGKVVLPDVAPGTYRLRVRDWHDFKGREGLPLFDASVVVPPGGRGEVRIPLGGGCIKGKVPSPRGISDWPVEVTAVAAENRGASRQARCDGKGNFCIRYLPPGAYTLFIRDPTSGRFARVEDVQVRDNAVDIGERQLEPGAILRGGIRFERPTPVPDEVVATGPRGVVARRAFRDDEGCDRVDLAGLWPGRWVVSARSRGEAVATAEVEVKGTGPHEVDLVARGKAEP